MSLGEGMTPVVALGEGTVAKLDFLNPTLSFKDRGAAILLAAVAARGIRRVIVDSSGNAGTAMAAYGAWAGMAVEIWVPGGTSPQRRRRCGRTARWPHRRRGPRRRRRGCGWRVESTGAFYASHVYQPLFFLGTKTVVLELWEQLGGRLPEVIVLPAGNGTLVLGPMPPSTTSSTSGC